MTIEKNITNTRWTSGVQSLTYFVFSALKGLHMCNWVDVLLNLCLKCVLNELLATLFLYAASTLMRSSKYLEKCHNYKQIPWVRWHIFIMTKGTLSIRINESNLQYQNPEWNVCTPLTLFQGISSSKILYGHQLTQ